MDRPVELSFRETGLAYSVVASLAATEVGYARPAVAEQMRISEPPLPIQSEAQERITRITRTQYALTEKTKSGAVVRDGRLHSLETDAPRDAAIFSVGDRA